MKKTILSILAISVMMVVLFQGNNYYAYAKNKSVKIEDIGFTRTAEEQLELSEIYKELFPDEYHFIEEYCEYGVNEKISKVSTIFYDSRMKDDIEYCLTIMDNGQIFISYKQGTGASPKSDAVGKRYDENFVVGDLQHYMTFRIQYFINYTYYDSILSGSVSGTGFYVPITNRRIKSTEDANSPAYYGYESVQMTGNITSVLYDIGVAVGRDTARGVTTLASGWDMFLWSLINAFFP